MTTILLTAPQRSALAAAKATHLGALFSFSGGRWTTGRHTESWHSSAIIDQLVIAGLLQRMRDRVVITEAGIAALEFNGRRSQGRALPVDAKTLKQIAADADEPVPEITHNADGSIEFTCAGCGQPVFMAVDDGFGFPACFECRSFDEHPQLQRPAIRHQHHANGDDRPR